MTLLFTWQLPSMTWKFTALFAQSSNWRSVFPSKTSLPSGKYRSTSSACRCFYMETYCEFWIHGHKWCIIPGNGILCAQIESSLKSKSFVLFGLAFQNWKINNGTGYWTEPHSLPDYIWRLSLGPKHPERCKCKMFSESSRSTYLR